MRVGVRMLRAAVALAALVGCLLALSPAAAQASGPISWGQPTWADRATPFTATNTSINSLQAVSCTPDAALCVAVEQEAAGVLVSTNPTDPSSWNAIGLYGLDLANGGGVSCPSASLCVIAAGKDIYATHTPTLAGSWKAAQIDTSGGLQDVSCPTASLCVAVDGSGNIFHSTNPAGGASAWSGPVAAGLTAAPTHISCPTTTFCAEAGYTQGLKTSDDPTGGASAWGDGTDTWKSSAISCPSSSLCVTTEANSTGTSVHTTTDPGDSAPTWTSYNVGVYLDGLACSPGASPVCAIGANGKLYVSSNPTATTMGTWTSASSITGTYIEGLSCPSSSLCLAVSHDGNIDTSTTPGTASSWTQATVDQYSRSLSLACPSAGLCVDGDDGGRALSSTAPGNGLPWTPTAVFTPMSEGAGLGGLSCAGSSLCAATDGTNVYVSTDPGAMSPSWSGPTQVDPSGHLAETSCPSINFCAAVGGSNLFISTDPAGASPTWTPTSVSGSPDFGAISCPTTKLCVAVDYLNGTILSRATSPQGVVQKQVQLSGLHFTGVSCSSISLCAAVASGGQVAVSTQPTGTASAWKVRQVEVPGTSGTGLLSAISCASHLCAAIDGNGFEYSNPDVTSATSPWTALPLDPAYSFDLADIACPLASYVCYAMNGRGQVRVGRVANEKLTVRRAGEGSGAVSGPSISCPATCSAGYPAGTQVTLRAHPSAGSRFKGWSGACQGTGPCRITLTASRIVTAVFSVPPPHKTRITSVKIHRLKGSATFGFAAQGKVDGFRCALVRGSGKPRFAKCSSPASYEHLRAGAYTFMVKAYNASGADPHPATRKFSIT